MKPSIYSLACMAMALMVIVQARAQSYYCPGPTAAPYPVAYTQPDGSTIMVLGKGSGYLNYMQTVDEYTLVAMADGYLAYAVQGPDGRLISSGIRANDPSKRTSDEQRFLAGLRPNTMDALHVREQKRAQRLEESSRRATFPTTGNRKVLMILIQYPDLLATNTADDFESLMNDANYNGTGSFRDFYSTSSFGSLNLTTDVYGWYTAANNYTYYAEDNGRARARGLAREAVDAAEADGVDFSQYDNDGDGNVDGVVFVHAGQGAEEGGISNLYIWSHRSALNKSGLEVTYDGVLIDDYMMNPERRNNWGSPRIVGIGIFSHEFGHGLGLPDLYDTSDSNGDSEGIGWWGLMGSGNWAGNEDTPTNFSAWSRIRLGWQTSTDITGRVDGFELEPACLVNHEVYRINSGAANQYFLLENRQNVGIDVSVPGHGLIIWHVDDNQTTNSDETHKWVDVEEADNLFDLDNLVNRGDNGDPFPGALVNRVFNDVSAPNSKRYDGTNTGVDINNIREEGTILKFNMGCEPAQAICRADINLSLDADGEATLSAADVDNGSTFDCGFASMTISQSLFTCADIGLNVVTLTVEDLNGNTDDCTVNVNVADELPPVLTVPSSLTVDCWYSPTGPAATGYATAVDNCDPTVSITYSDEEFDLGGGARKIIRTWRAEDNDANITSAAQLIYIPPPITLDAGEDQTVYVDFVGIPGYPYSACADLMASAYGGTPPYTYAWSDGQSGQSITVCPDVCTQYTVTITDANGCVQEDDLVVYAIVVECMQGANQNIKYLICHNGLTLCTSFSATAVHLGHGDGLGACGDIGNQGCEDIPPLQVAGRPGIEPDAWHPTDYVMTPNPARDVVEVSLRQALPGEYRIGVWNAGGSQVFDHRTRMDDAGFFHVQIPVGHLVPGIYFLRIMSPDGNPVVRTFGVYR